MASHPHSQVLLRNRKKRPATFADKQSADVGQPIEEATGEKDKKRGGRHPEHAQSQRDYALALESAQKKAEQGEVEPIIFFSRFVVALEWQERWTNPANMQEMECNFDNALIDILGTTRDSISTPKHDTGDGPIPTGPMMKAAITCEYAFPNNDPFFTRLTRKDWEYFLAAAYALRTGRMPEICTPPEKLWGSHSYAVQIIQQEPASLTLVLEVCADTMSRAESTVSDAKNFVEVLRRGGMRCASCDRSTCSLTDTWCCSSCKDSPGVHDDDCDALLASRTERLPKGPLQFALSRPAQIELLMESTLEAKQPFQGFSIPDLEALAEAVNSDSRFARPYGVTKTVSSEGRFTVQCFGNERVGCYLCRTKSMNKGSWFAHASSKAHARALARTKRSPGSAGASESPVDPFDQILRDHEAARDGELRAALRAMGARDRPPRASP